MAGLAPCRPKEFLNVAVKFGVNAANESVTSPDCVAGWLSSMVALSNTCFRYVPPSR